MLCYKRIVARKIRYEKLAECHTIKEQQMQSPPSPRPRKEAESRWHHPKRSSPQRHRKSRHCPPPAEHCRLIYLCARYASPLHGEWKNAASGGATTSCVSNLLFNFSNMMSRVTRGSNAPVLHIESATQSFNSRPREGATGDSAPRGGERAVSTRAPVRGRLQRCESPSSSPPFQLAPP